MDGQDLNAVVGWCVAFVGFVTWGYIVRVAPHEYPVSAPLMWFLSVGLLLVSTLSLAHEPRWVGVFAAANRAIVAGLGVRAVHRYRQSAARSARREP